jgi:CDP-paratose 2-epimerase
MKSLSDETILITGGCGFVGSNLSIKLKRDFPSSRIISFDNLKRRGSELNIPRLQEAGVEFTHGDIRNKEDLESVGDISLLIEAAAEPSVLSGINSTPDYVINTNLSGTVNCLNLAKKQKAKFVFLSTSRVYPIAALNQVAYTQEKNRFVLSGNQHQPGVSEKGISEKFDLGGARSFYGASKLCSELLIQEYAEFYDVKTIINRCGVITGPWQMGRVDQGVIVLWLARHFWKKELSYIGYGGLGKQVRDILYIDDLYDILICQLRDFSSYKGQTFNIGGGPEVSVSLCELTELCQIITGNKIAIQSVNEDRPADVPIYISDTSKVSDISGWKPKYNIRNILEETFAWMKEKESMLQPFLG